MPPADPWLIVPLTLVAVAVGLLLPGGWAARLTLRPWRAAVLVGVTNLVANLVVAAHAGLPQVHVQDEYGYALIADTLLHGRLANPTPADADALASPHELMRPAYAAKYPPGQGVALAVGRLLGRDVYGVWLTTAVAAAAVGWAAAAFVAPPWALLAGLVAAIHPTMLEWGHTFWGGGVAALGGALAVGAWGRLMATEAPDVHPGLLLGVGLTVLADSRPYEGLALSLPLLPSLAWHWRRGVRWRAIIPLLAVLAAGVAFTLLYDSRVTGHPLRLPLAAYAARYDVAPKLWPLPMRRPPLPTYPNHTMAWEHLGYEVGGYLPWRTGLAALPRLRGRAWDLLATVATPAVLLVPLALAAGVRRVGLLWFTAGLFAVAIAIESIYLDHYAAPAAAVAVVLVTLGWRRLHAASPRLGRGLVLGYAVATAAIVTTTFRDPGPLGQAALTALDPRFAGGRHLIFVRYTADHPPHDEWVYNGADPASDRLLWAHARGPAADRSVAHDYPGRQVWQLTVGPHDLVPRRYAP